MYCKNCGQKLEDTAKWCPSCGEKQVVDVVEEPLPDLYAEPPAAPQPPKVDFNEEIPEEKGGFLWGLLGCCIPLVGLILFLVWRDSKPKTAKSAGIGAIVGVVIGIISSILTYVVGIGAFMLM